MPVRYSRPGPGAIQRYLQDRVDMPRGVWRGKAPRWEPEELAATLRAEGASERFIRTELQQLHDYHSRQVKVTPKTKTPPKGIEQYTAAARRIRERIRSSGNTKTETP